MNAFELKRRITEFLNFDFGSVFMNSLNFPSIAKYRDAKLGFSFEI